MKTIVSMAGAVVASLALTTGNAGDEPTVVSKQELAKRYLGLNPNDIHDGPIEGLYEVASNMNVSYITKDGRYLIRGEIVDLGSQRNLTTARLDSERGALFAKIDPATEIVFPADGDVKHKIIVFTDVDCGYCRQFHRDIAKVNAMGVEVHYVSYPRTGPNTASWSKAVGVWCAEDRQTALTQAKLGAEVPKVPGCKSSPVAKHYELGRTIRLPGTPGIYTESGVDLGGYFPPDELVARLEKLDAPPPAAADAPH